MEPYCGPKIRQKERKNITMKYLARIGFPKCTVYVDSKYVTYTAIVENGRTFTFSENCGFKVNKVICTQSGFQGQQSLKEGHTNHDIGNWD